jgi:putative ABC transport system permease protein
MRRAIIKDTYREIRHTFSRFLSIFFIVLLGVSFFAGIKSTCPDMKLTADKYFDDYSLMDIRVLSTLGLTDADLAAVRNIPGVERAMPAYSMDFLVSINQKDTVVKAISLEDTTSPAHTGINGVKLVDGRMPKAPNECLGERGRIFNQEMDIGSVLTLKSGTDKDIGENLKNTVFTVVGIVETPYYISFERGTSSIGSGNVNCFIMIPQENFKLDYYTDIYATVRGAAEKPCYDDGYKDTVEPVTTALEDISGEREQARYREVVDEANDKLSDSKAELADAEEEQRAQLADALRKLGDAKEKIDDGEKEIDDNQAEFHKQIDKAKDKLNAGYSRLKEGEKEYRKQSALYVAAKKQAAKEFPAAEEKIKATERQLAESEAALNLLKYKLTNDPTLTPEQKAMLAAQIAAGEAQLSAGKAQLEAAKAELAGRKKELKEAGAKLKAAKKLLDSSRAKLSASRAKLLREQKKTQEKIDRARLDLRDAKEEYARGQKDYDRAKLDSDEKIGDARRKIADGERDISEIEQPEWYVLDRDTNPGFVEYGQAADRMDAIAQVFPVFFILVTALVCLTTMTRMVDEQRTYIGTLKALGYSKAAIAGKYLAYAALASITGSVAGVFLGFAIFPTVISNAYAIMYTLPHVINEFNVPYAVVSIVFAVLTTSFTAWAACYRELKEVPASLMRPKAPRPGKRIFLERIPIIWSKFNFSRKITMRNIFRYKRRFAMTVFGIAGCMALMLSGFGLKDSITSIASKQFDELYRYNLSIQLEDGPNSVKDVSELLQRDSRIKESMLAKEQNITVLKGDAEKDATLFVPESAEKLPGFIALRDRESGKNVAFADGGVLLTEKLASKIGASPGDTVTIEDADHNRRDARVSGITENYVSHYVYMSPAYYTALFREEPEFREAFAKTSGTDEAFENALSTDIMKNGAVSSLRFTTNISRDFNDIIKSLYYVVLVLIVSAGALAIVVLYNLTNINIMERLREIATIKVLGFYDMEVSAYVFRENIILTAIGMAIGVFFGIYLHKFIVVTAEVDYVMFGRDIFYTSYLYSVLLTVFFTGIVNFAMFFRLKRIDMVESLKSVD